MLSQWHVATIGVANLDVALAFWIDLVGYNIVSTSSGGDCGLGRQWSLPAEAFKRQALIGYSENLNGRLHLIEMNTPGVPVRSGSSVYDACLKNIDIYVSDIESRIVILRNAGYTTRTDLHSDIIAADGTRFREMHMAIHDGINLVLLELPDVSMSINSKGFGAIGPLISVVPKIDVEKRFYREVLGLEMLTDNFFEGDDIERMIGLPAGAGLDVSIWGRPGQWSAQLELVQYAGVRGENRFPLSRLPNCGLHQVCFCTRQVAHIIAAAQRSRAKVVHLGRIETLVGTGECWSIYTPAGLRIDLLATVSS
jgi:catechol 2,3-dioxygenase-like lactoylglutathione lyase family enzyme